MKMFENNVIANAAKRFGTPLYLYDGGEIKTTYRTLRKIAPKQMDIFYSMKANPLLGICQLLQQENACCEVCSEAELHVALQAGFEPRNIIFVGPGKSLRELELCVEHNIYAVVCESLDELIRLNNIARKHNVKCNVLLRINPEFSVSNAPLKMGGKPTQFGMDLPVLQEHIKQILCYSNIKISGIHVYNGTRILDANGIVENTINILNLARQLSAQWSIKFDCIDIGGGFGIPYFEGEKDLNIEDAFSGMALTIENYLHDFPGTRFILECGRYLVGKSGVLISQIISVKKSHGENFLIGDAGMNCHMAATGIGSFMRRNFPVDVISHSVKNEDEQQVYNITGPLCTPGDVLAKQIKLPKVDVGDFVIVKNSGAYGPTASPVRFLSHGFPAEALFDNEALFLLRRRETVENILENQIPINIFHGNKLLIGEEA